ncbi:hypothetical protein OsJ_36253 [Oryza sativa Japonica Group]|uniref:Uncharacterized protein n=1 Tax=Oryza sativa subsp. japonica TaxID=39947 RepID=B9GDD7_ORYSJ|nr:hypothetical protein OsJ_36253 [Oryza sativa Japonica Group]
MAPHKAIKRLQCLPARFLEYSKSQNLEIGLDLLSPFPKDEGGKRNGSFKEGVDGGIGGRGIRVSRRELMVGLVMGVTFLVPILTSNSLQVSRINKPLPDWLPRHHRTKFLSGRCDKFFICVDLAALSMLLTVNKSLIDHDFWDDAAQSFTLHYTLFSDIVQLLLAMHGIPGSDCLPTISATISNYYL